MVGEVFVAHVFFHYLFRNIYSLFRPLLYSLLNLFVTFKDVEGGGSSGFFGCCSQRYGDWNNR